MPARSAAEQTTPSAPARTASSVSAAATACRSNGFTNPGGIAVGSRLVRIVTATTRVVPPASRIPSHAAATIAPAARTAFTATIDPTTTDVAAEFARITGQLPSTIVECVGIPGMIQHAADVAAIDAHVTVVGVCIPPDQLTPFTALSKELSLQFVLYYSRASFAATLEALAHEALDPTPLVTARITLDELPHAFDALKHPTTDCKVIVHP